MDTLLKPVIDLFKNNVVFNIIFSSLLHDVSLPMSVFPIAQILHVLTLAGVVLFIMFFVYISLYILCRFLRTKIQLNSHYVFLELKPPSESLQSSFTTQQLFTLMHNLAKHQTWFEKLIGYQKSYSFEIVSTKEEGIRYILRLDEGDADSVKKGFLSYLQGMSVLETNEYLPILHDSKVSIAEFVLQNHFAFSLKRQNELEEHDPIAYITGSMTKLMPDELVSFQLIAAPVRKSSIKDIKRISHLIYKNKDLVEGLNRTSGSNWIFIALKVVVHLFLHILMLPIGILVFFVSDSNEGPFLNLPFEKKKDKTLNPYQSELEVTVKGKLDQPIFSTSIRLIVVGNKLEAQKRIRGFTSSLSTYSNSYQALVQSGRIHLQLIQKLRLFLFQNRILGLFSNPLLSVSEVSDLYHFPFTSTTQTENIQKVHSKELPAPVSLKKSIDLDVVFAKNTYGGSSTDIGLTVDERLRHMYMLGATGTGKSTLLLSMIKQDMEHKKGLCVIDPHGELIENILPLIPEDRIQDVIYFNPDDISFPIGLNVMELPSDITGDLLLREKEVIAESIISLFHKVWGEQYTGPRMEYILRNTIHTAFYALNPTLFTIYKLLIDEEFRNEIVAKVEDENLRDFWKLEFGKAGDFQIASMISPITNKIGRFLFSPIAKRILEQEKSTINFDQILDSGKILLCNVSKGKIGEDNSAVFGALIMTKIQLATLKRARVKSSERRDFYLYVDEFQNFATSSFAQILSEARKYKLNAILAHQTTSQLEDMSLVNITLANTGTIICFRTANPEDERVILPQFMPYVSPGEINNLPAFHFYIKISALHPEEPFSGETIQVVVPQNSKKVDKIIQTSRRNYAIDFHAQIPKQLTRKVKAKRPTEAIRVDAITTVVQE